MFTDMSGEGRPKTRADVPTRVLIPAFVLSELQTAFEIGFLILIPFLIIDMVIASTVMSMGMVMLPPVVISLPFKILLFVLVDGWHLVSESLIRGFVDSERRAVNQSQIMEIGAKAMWVTLELSLPILGVSLVVGLLVSIFQAVTQLQEPTLTFIPKILAVVVVIVFAGPWMMNTMLDFTVELWAGISLDRSLSRAATWIRSSPSWRPQATLFMLIATRLSAMIAVAPVFSSRMVPVRVKAGLVIVISFVTLPGVAALGGTVPDGHHPVRDAGGEGGDHRLRLRPDRPVPVRGDPDRRAPSSTRRPGFAVAQTLDPTSNVSISVLGRWYNLIAISCFIALGGAQLLVAGIVRSFTLAPPLGPARHERRRRGRAGPGRRHLPGRRDGGRPGDRGPAHHGRDPRHHLPRRPPDERLHRGPAAEDHRGPGRQRDPAPGLHRPHQHPHRRDVRGPLPHDEGDGVSSERRFEVRL